MVGRFLTLLLGVFTTLVPMVWATIPSLRGYAPTEDQERTLYREMAYFISNQSQLDNQAQCFYAGWPSTRGEDGSCRSPESNPQYQSIIQMEEVLPFADLVEDGQMIYEACGRQQIRCNVSLYGHICVDRSGDTNRACFERAQQVYGFPSWQRESRINFDPQVYMNHLSQQLRRRDISPVEYLTNMQRSLHQGFNHSREICNVSSEQGRKGPCQRLGYRTRVIRNYHRARDPGQRPPRWVREDCQNVECVEALIDEAKEIEREGTEENCFPPAVMNEEEQVSNAAMGRFYREHPITNSCLRKLRRWREIQDKLEVLSIHLATAESRRSQCEIPEQITIEDEVQELQTIARETPPSCSASRKRELRNQCPGDMLCLGLSGLTSAGNVVPGLGLAIQWGADAIRSDESVRNCSMLEDNCMNQLMLEFVSSAWSFIKTLGGLVWDGVTWVSGKAWDGVVGAWNWAWGIEDESSSRQLAAAQASEDEGVFDLIRRDPGAALKKLWEGISTGFMHYLKNDLFCQEWDGVPHFSNCLEPMTTWDCLSCKNQFLGICSSAGAILLEVLPAFFTGGAVSAIKHGAKAASTIAKTLARSIGSRAGTLGRHIASSRMGRLAIRAGQMTARGTVRTVQATTRVVRRVVPNPALRAGRYLDDAGRFIVSRSRHALGMISRYGYHLPKQKLLQVSRWVGNSAVWRSPVIASGGQGIRYLWRVGRGTLRVVTYPIDNPLTRGAYQLGHRMMDDAIEATAKAARRRAPGLTLASSSASAGDDAVRAAQGTSGMADDAVNSADEVAQASRADDVDDLQFSRELTNEQRQELRRVLVDTADNADDIRRLPPEQRAGVVDEMERLWNRCRAMRPGDRALAMETFKAYTSRTRLAIVMGLYLTSHIGEQKNARWFSELGYNFVMAVLGSKIPGLIMQGSSGSAVSAALRENATYTGFNFISSRLYAQAFGISEDEARERIAAILEDERKVEALRELDQHITALVQEPRFQQLASQYREELGSDVPLADASEATLRDPQVQALVQEAYQQYEYEQNAGLMQTGSSGNDRFFYSLGFDAAFGLPRIAIYNAVLRGICMGRNFDALAVYFSTTIGMTGVYFGGREMLINQ